ncbi:MAG: PH domain-containing protein [Lachnospiraceae bacterium]|nr:PH domain-containing protein [Lachnospiraceae bacterium]
MEYRERKRLLFLGLPWTFTVYRLSEDMVSVKAGFFRTVEDDCYMYKIHDVKLVRGLVERIFGLGTVICYTGDKTHPEKHLSHIKNAREIKDFILDASEKARVKRRTLHTLDIGESGLDVL